MSWRNHTIDNIKANVPYACVGGPFGSELTTRDYVDSGIPVIRGNNLSSKRKFLDGDFVFVSEQKANSLSSNLAFPNDLVFTQRGTLGQVGIIPGEANYERYVISQSQMKLTVEPKIARPEFVYYYFRQPRIVQTIRCRAISSGVPHINLGILKSMSIGIPSLDEQSKILDVLSSYDDLIENNRRRIQLLEQAARLLYKEWFVRLRFPGHEHVKIKDGVPEGWEKTIVGLCTSFLGRGISPNYDDEAPGIVINQRCIRDGMVDMEPSRHQSREVPPNKTVHLGDVLINSTGEGTLGRIAQVRTELEKCTVDSHVTIARPAKGIPVHYFGLSLRAVEPFISTLGRGATNQTELARDTIAQLRIVLPSTALANAFDEIVAPISRQMCVLAEKSTRLRAARDLLLPRLMNGEIAV
jgi:type I restriction enzyme S subunit